MAPAVGLYSKGSRMALVSCRECGRQVSTEASTCPHCGVPGPSSQPREKLVVSPGAPILEHAARRASTSQADLRKESRRKTLGELKLGLVILGGLAVLVGLGQGGKSSSSSSRGLE